MNTAPQRLHGVFVPVLTPFEASHAPAPDRYVRHCKWLVGQGAGLAPFGTNSEANSLSLAEKRRLLDTLLEASVPTARMMPGTGACALPDAADLTRHAVRAGCGGVLMLPPFFYKGVSDEGLYRYYAGVIDAVADERLRVYLYHIPQMSGVPIGLDLIERLLARFPGTVAGIKDSSGEWPNTAAMLERFAVRGFDIFVGSESFLLANLRGGGAGCITAVGNVAPAPIVKLYQGWQQPEAEAQQEAVDATRQLFAAFPLVAAMKAAIAMKSGNAAWRTVRPPLVELNADQRAALEAALKAAKFELPDAHSLA